MADGLTRINFVADLGSSPARVNRYTGECWINRRLWNNMPYEHRLFVLLHENAHVALCTADEHAADALAFKMYSDRGHSLTQSVYALSKILNFNNPEHYDRLSRQFHRAIEYDVNVNGNKKALQPMNGSFNIISENSNYRPIDNMSEYFGTDSLFGIAIGKKAKERKQQKKEDRQEFKLQKIAAKAEGKATVAAAKNATGMENLFDPSLIAASMAANAAPAYTPAPAPAPAAAQSSGGGANIFSGISGLFSGNKKWIMIGVLVLIVAAIIWYVKFRKKS